MKKIMFLSLLFFLFFIACDMNTSQKEEQKKVLQKQMLTQSSNDYAALLCNMKDMIEMAEGQKTKEINEALQNLQNQRNVLRGSFPSKEEEKLMEEIIKRKLKACGIDNEKTFLESR